MVENCENEQSGWEMRGDRAVGGGMRGNRAVGRCKADMGCADEVVSIRQFVQRRKKR